MKFYIIFSYQYFLRLRRSVGKTNNNYILFLEIILFFALSIQVGRNLQIKKKYFRAFRVEFTRNGFSALAKTGCEDGSRDDAEILEFSEFKSVTSNSGFTLRINCRILRLKT